MAKALAANGSLVLAAEGEMAVVVDVELNVITASGAPDELRTLMDWPDEADDTMLLPVAELVESALNSLDLEILTAAGGRRMYTIPAGVQAEAKKSLEWRKKFKRGGTPVGMNTARTLARGGQIGIEKVRHIAKYFPRHEVDKKGKGWSPGEDGFPSRGRIAWALWGGDAAWRWARAIVERENKRAKTLKAAGEYNLYQQDEDTAFVDYNTYTVGADTSAFEQAYEGIDGAPEFMARVRMDGSGIDRLYKIDLDGKVYVWDSGYWDDLGTVYGDIYTYDAALDDPYDRCQKAHVQIDPESALMLSAFFQVDPFIKVSVNDLDAEEARLAADGAAGIDWALVEQSMVAAGEDPIGEGSDDGYTSDERAENAGKQVRDGSGRFAAQGTRVSVTGRPQGVITGINATNKMVTVQHDDGTTSTVPASSTRRLSDEQIQVQSQAPTAQEAGEELAPFDTSGILAEPRTPSNRPGVQLPGTLPPLTRNDLAQVLSDYPAWVASQRDLFKPLATGPAAAPGAAPETAPGSAPTGTQNTKPAAVDPRTPFHLTDPVNLDTGKAGKALKDLTGVDMITNAYSHPALAKWLAKKEKKDGKTVTPNALWYQPITSAGDEKPTTPAFDVKPIYMAIVADDDPLAVVDLISIVPESLESNEPMTYARRNKKWERDPRIITDLKSATPPSVVPLDEATLNDVLLQLDGHAALAASATVYSLDHVLMALWGPNDEEMQRRLAELHSDDVLTAAGGADRNRGNAEALRRYWTKGKGAAKIRWGTGGDWKRCVRYLGKYLGPRAKGYCALRHKEVTGLWTGDQKHRKLYGWGKTAAAFATEQDIRPFDDVLETMTSMAQVEDARERVRGITAGGAQDGGKFYIPLVIPEGVESGDGRMMRKGALEIRELPLPLMWQIKTGDGHDGSVVVGRIDRMSRTDSGIGEAYGVFDTGAYGREAERMVREGFIRGVSADLDKFEADDEPKDKADTTAEKDGKKKKDKLVVTKARVMGVTIVPKPAFQECKIVLQQDTNTQEDTVIQSGTYVEDMDFAEAEALIACGYVAGAIPLVPPSDWFKDPKLDKPTPLTVDDSGRVYGHIAAWHVDHIGMAFGTRPPRSKSKYAYFHTGVLRTEDGNDVPVGQLTLAGGHASLHASASEAAKHYDDTASAVADVHAGEDAHGIWVAGSLRPGVNPEQVRALRASAPSGDWRPIKGSLELVAVCQVNVPGFPIARARVASGSVMALVAAGAQVLAKMKSNPVSELENRLRRLESIVASGEKLPSTDELKARVAAAKAEMSAQAEAQVLAAAEAAKVRFAAFNTETDASYTSEFEDEMAYISRETRKKLASEGKALPDGSYPIRNASDLRNAIQAYGRAKNKAAAKRHIIKRARGLGKADLIPSEWTSAAVDGESLTASVDAMRARAAEIEAELKKD